MPRSALRRTAAAPKGRVTPAEVAANLLAWYDRHGRDLPWRARAGEASDPYRVWLSEIMLQQTTVAAVKPYFARFTALWPRVFDLAGAPTEAVMREWAGLGYYARARNLHACARAVVERHGGRFPGTEAELRLLPGVGQYTAAAIAAIAFGEAATVVDGNVERVVSRLFAVEEPLPAARTRLRLLAATLVPKKRPGDFAQATMDLGATICTPRRPLCGLCPLNATCAAKCLALQDELPRRSTKPQKAQRFGIVAIVEDPRGAILMRTRPANGLLGGMSEVFGSDWTTQAAAVTEVEALCGREMAALGVVEHVFTHFALHLDVYRGVSPTIEAPAGWRWVLPENIEKEAMSALTRKVLAVASSQRSAAARPDANRLELLPGIG